MDEDITIESTYDTLYNIYQKGYQSFTTSEKKLKKEKLKNDVWSIIDLEKKYGEGE